MSVRVKISYPNVLNIISPGFWGSDLHCISSSLSGFITYSLYSANQCIKLSLILCLFGVEIRAQGGCVHVIPYKISSFKQLRVQLPLSA